MPALKAIVDTLDDVAEPLRELYTKASDGKFRLQVDGLEDTSSLTRALTSERTRAGNLERDLKKLQKDIEGLDPEKARAAQAKLQEIEEAALMGKVPEGLKPVVEEIVRQRTERMVSDHKAQVLAFEKQVKELSDGNGSLTTKLSDLLIDGALSTAFGEAKAKPHLLTHLVTIAKAGGVDGIKWEMRDGKAVPIDTKAADGAIKFGANASEPLTPKEFAALARERLGDLFEGSTGSGAQNGVQSGNGNVTLTREQARDNRAYRQAQEQANKSGGQLVVQ